jgi:hypothetical protein
MADLPITNPASPTAKTENKQPPAVEKAPAAGAVPDNSADPNWVDVAAQRPRPLVPPQAPPATAAPSMVSRTINVAKDGWPCPVLRALANSGYIHVAPDGTVNLDELQQAAADQLGMPAALARVVHGIGYGGNKASDVLHNVDANVINLRALPQGEAVHIADTRILKPNGDFSEANFERLTAHAVDGGNGQKWMTLESFAQALVENVKRDKGQPALELAKGRALAHGEFGALLNVFGTKTPNGQLGIPVSELRALWQEAKLPPHYQPSVEGLTQTLASLSSRTTALAMKNAWSSSAHTASGLVHRAISFAFGHKTPQAGPASGVGAGKASGACPYLNGQMAMPTTPEALNEMVSAHCKVD